MKILVIGGGGREHALAWRLVQSPKTHKIYLAPGNGGTAQDARFENVPMTDVNELCAWALAQKIVANSGFSHAANKRLLEATDGGPLDAGLQWEVMESEGHGPDMHERIGAFMGKGK